MCKKGNVETTSKNDEKMIKRKMNSKKWCTTGKWICYSFWMRASGSEHMKRGYWREDTEERILKRGYWREDTEERILKRGYWREDTEERICSEDMKIMFIGMNV
jgi:hypothetical protein